MEKTKNILIVAGEASGDLHGSNLVKAIKDIEPRINFFGLGGKRLKQAGVDLHFDLTEIAVVGIFEVLKNIKKFKSAFRCVLREIDRQRPDLAILIDYPGFNLRLAEELKKRSIPVIYYISPQVWAWGKGRIKKIKRLVLRIIVVFKFEEELYLKHNIPVSFVGHPLLDIVKSKTSKEEFLSRIGLDTKNLTFSLLPGSREKEVKALLPIMLKTSELIYKEIPNSQFLILRSPTTKEDIFNDIVSRFQVPVKQVTDMTYDGLNASDFALVASGTATLEAAILGVPMVILYKVSFLTWVYLKTAIKIPCIGLVNVIKQKKIIEEFIQYNARPKKISRYIISTIKDKDKINNIKQGLSEVTRLIGEKGANLRAAKVILDLLNKK